MGEGLGYGFTGRPELQSSDRWPSGDMKSKEKICMLTFCFASEVLDLASSSECERILLSLSPCGGACNCEFRPS